MKVTSVELHPEGSPSVFVLSFRDPRSQNPYQVKAIMGLDADEIIPKYYGQGGSGQSYYELTLNKRDVVVRVVLNPDFPQMESYSDLRDRLWRIVSSSRTGKVVILFKDGNNVVAHLVCMVGKVETTLFTDEPEVQMTFPCDDPMLKSLERYNVGLAGLHPSNTVITDNKSTAAHGLKFRMTFTAPVSNIVIKDNSNDWQFKASPYGGFQTGDVLHYSSEPGDKYLYMVRGSTTTHLMDVIEAGSIWPIIFPGDNVIKTTAPVVWSKIEHYLTYWGV